MRRSLVSCAIALGCCNSFACSSSTNTSPGSAGTGGSGGTSASVAGSAGSVANAGSVGIGGAGGVTGGAGTSSVGGSGVGGTSGGTGAGGGTPSTSQFKLDSVATWRGNATSAYSIIHDDVCDDSADGVFDVGGPALKARGLHAGFGVIVSECKVPADDVDKWPQVKTLISDGNDIFSHSWSHPCIDGDPNSPPDACPPPSGPPDGAVYSSDLATELGKAGDELKAQTGVSLDFFIFPYDYCAPAAIAYLKDKGYLGARCGITDGIPTNPPSFTDPFNAFYEVFGPAYSYYWDKGVCNGKVSQYNSEPYDLGDSSAFPLDPPDCTAFIMKQYVDDTIAAKGWGIREFHGFHPMDDAAGAFEPISAADYGTHLDYIKAKQDSGALWVEGPSRVVRYRFAREACPQPTVTGNTLHFAAASADCKKYDTVVSYLISTTDSSDPASLQVQQGARTLTAKKLSAGHFVVDADPLAGDAVLVQ